MKFWHPFLRSAVMAIAVTVLVTTSVMARAQTIAARSADARASIAEAVAAGFAGQVLAVVDGEVVLDEAYGIADDATGAPVTRSTVFAIGSVTKVFTRAAILKLAEEGRLSLGDAMSDHLANVPEDKRGITIDELLTMRAGFHEYHDDSGDHQAMTRSEALERILGQQLRFAPGTDEAYSNSGYVLLAAIVENVTDQPFSEYVRTALLEPAGMSNTGFHGDDSWADADVARGRNNLEYGDNRPNHWPEPTWVLVGAGGMVSNTADLLQWILAVRDGRVLGQQALARFYPEDEPHRLYAGGDDFGFITAVMEIDQADDVVIVTTHTGYPVMRLAGEVIEKLRGAPLPFGLPSRGGGTIERETTGGEVTETTGEGIPDSPRGRKAMAVVDALRDGSPEALERLVNEHFSAGLRDGFSMQQHLEILGELSEELRRATDVGVQPAGEFAIELRTVDATGESGTYIVELEEEPPHGIAGIRRR